MSVIGSTIEEAYLVLVDATLILYFIPYLYLFAAVIKLRRGHDNKGVIVIPGGKVGLYLAVGAGLFATTASIVLALIPGQDVASPMLITAKVVGGTLAFLLVGLALFRRYAGTVR